MWKFTKIAPKHSYSNWNDWYNDQSQYCKGKKERKGNNDQNITLIQKHYLRNFSLNYLHVNFQDDVNMKATPIMAVVTLRSASERLVVAAFFMTWVSSDSLLRSSPVRVTSKKAISCWTIVATPCLDICWIPNVYQSREMKKTTKHIWTLANQTNILKGLPQVLISFNQLFSLCLNFSRNRFTVFHNANGIFNRLQIED